MACASSSWLRTFPSNTITTTNSGESLKQLAIHGHGILCLSDFTVRNELKNGKLVPLQLRRVLIPLVW
ncbi:LysR substrate-binding domain-containing protein [Kiloniella litopenaei]|uniref:LysR substrate-binding domain-containing protein n=1 Tax=Kiloniella litopenaei TaxID=1549748 RepID=UPI003BADB23B